MQNEASLNVMGLLSDIVAWVGTLSSMEPTIYFQKDVDAVIAATFQVWHGKYISPQGQICTALVLSADCTECSFPPNILIFNNFLVFKLSFV